MGTAGGTEELERSDAVGIVRVNQVCEGDLERSNQGLGGLGGVAMENFESEDWVVGGTVDGESEPLVPDRTSRSGFVRFCSDPVVRTDPKDDVGLEFSMFPVNILEMLSGDDGDVDVQRTR